MLTNILLKLQTESREVGGLRLIASTRDEEEREGGGTKIFFCLFCVVTKEQREGRGEGLGEKTCEKVLWDFLLFIVYTVLRETGKRLSKALTYTELWTLFTNTHIPIFL